VKTSGQRLKKKRGKFPIVGRDSCCKEMENSEGLKRGSRDLSKQMNKKPEWYGRREQDNGKVMNPWWQGGLGVARSNMMGVKWLASSSHRCEKKGLKESPSRTWNGKWGPEGKAVGDQGRGSRRFVGEGAWGGKLQCVRPRALSS